MFGDILYEGESNIFQNVILIIFDITMKMHVIFEKSIENIGNLLPICSKLKYHL